jgi:hypothetical protein
MNVHASTILDFLHQHSHRISHVAVAHTRYKTFERTDEGMKRIVELAKRDCTHFRNCFNRALYGRKAMKEPLRFQPLLIATLEGSLINTDRHLTLHYNFALGNLPSNMSDTELMHRLRGSWVGRAAQRDDIWIRNIAGDTQKAKGWIGYSMKEAEDKGNTAVWDFENTQIPYAAFDAS